MILPPDNHSPASARRAYLFADPAAHSLSPVMHRAAFAWAGLNGDYEAERVTPADLPGRMAALRDDELALGVNLSLPHKETVLSLLDDLTPAARQIGAVNTVIRRGRHLTGDNTDAAGLLMALADADFHPAPGSCVLVLGAGGAARAAVYAAAVGLQRDVYLVNRTRARAEELAAQWNISAVQVKATTLAEVPWPAVGLIVNSSSAGLNNLLETPLPDFDFHLCRQAAVYDMVYKPAETKLMQDARQAGLRAENGLGMLAQQARLAFRAWTGVDVPVQVFLGALGWRVA